MKSKNNEKFIEGQTLEFLGSVFETLGFLCDYSRRNYLYEMDEEQQTEEKIRSNQKKESLK